MVLLLQGHLSNAYSTVYVQTEQDTLRTDTSTLTPKTFEDIKDKYSDDEFIYERTVENSGWWTRFKQWLRDQFNIESGNGNASDIVDWFFWIVAAIIFILVVFFLFKAIINKEGRWVFGKSSDKSIIPVTDIEANIHATDFKSLIASAESDNNYRLAVRYYYLWLLKALTNAEIIEYDVEKTNSDYYNEITTQNIRDEFSYTSYLYNYIWYGEFNVDQQQFGKAKRAFINFLNTVKA